MDIKSYVICSIDSHVIQLDINSKMMCIFDVECDAKRYMADLPKDQLAKYTIKPVYIQFHKKPYEEMKK